MLPSSVDTSDYLSLLLSIPDLSIIQMLTLFFLTVLRIAPIVALIPFLGAKLPVPVKMGLVVALTAVFLPFVIATAKPPYPVFDVFFIALGLKEFFIGFILAFLGNIPFYMAQSSGVIIDFQRGSSALQTTDPLLQNQTSPIGQLYHYTLIVLFYQVGGIFLFLQAVINSYSAIAVNGFISSQFFTLHHGFWKFLIVLLSKFSAISIQLAAPSLVAILMADMFLGIINRLAQQVQIAFLGMSLKSLVGLLLLWSGWYLILQQLAIYSQEWIESVDRVVQLIPPQ
ncbi:EscT/YscT/HrcT family type III secretion system export apparatus protein [Rhabdochlamydiaceae symbiont of Dictyostelium giganteum]|uniref:EscT/YscT/HrcT family type III secretion system export apparatus protein n=1 Tax=Rhabdochlamydiaceae symbiont of Dictyostelium giganteum TaxID=3342349 RepID=UPI00384C7996